MAFLSLFYHKAFGPYDKSNKKVHFIKKHIKELEIYDKSCLIYHNVFIYLINQIIRLIYCT